MVTEPPVPRQGFASTQWSVVLEAHDLDDSTARRAMNELGRAYWPPLFAFARRRGYDIEDARDLVQGFFARLIETEGLKSARRDRGRFRSYLLGAFKHFLSHSRDRAKAAKRGGGTPLLSLDLVEAEGQTANAAVDERTPERIYEERYALTLLDRTLARLRHEWTAAGRGETFDLLKGFLTGEDSGQDKMARRLGLSPGALRAAVYRLRRRFGKLLRLEVAATVERPEDIDDELREILAILRGEA